MTGTPSGKACQIFYCSPGGLKAHASVDSRMHFYRFLKPIMTFTYWFFESADPDLYSNPACRVREWPLPKHVWQYILHISVNN